MNKLMSLFLVMTLATACGAKHNGSATTANPSTQNPAAKPQKIVSDKTLAVTNLDSSVREYVTDEGEKMTIIGTFAKSELAALTAGTAESKLPLGSVNATWENSTYAAHTEGTDPKPTLSQNTVEYPATIAYAILDRANPSVISIAVAETKYDKLKPTYEDVNISYNDQITCIHYTLNNPMSAAFHLPATQLSCGQNLVCEVTPGIGDKYKMSIADFENQMNQSNTDLGIHQSLTCDKNKSLPTEHATLENTSTVISYEVVLKSDFSDVAKNVTFSAQKQ